MYSLDHDTLDLLAFNLKAMGRKSTKDILLSTGTLPTKQAILPAIRTLSQMRVNIYATAGTSTFLTANRVTNTRIHKIAENIEPNIRSFLGSGRFDLVINILTGDPDYDEQSDSRLIRKLAFEHGIPVITDADFAIMAIESLHEKQRLSEQPVPGDHDPWDLKAEFFRHVNKNGGLSCHHAHFDKAMLINADNLRLSHADMQRKWTLYRFLKENYTHEDLVRRMSRCAEIMIQQGVTFCKTFVDADAIVGMLPINAALEVKKRYEGRLRLEIGVQPLEGVLDPSSRKIFTDVCELADFVGGLPSKDRPQPEKHLDYVMCLAREMGKRLEVHVDQENSPLENETELLAVKAIEHGMEGNVMAIHAISVAAKPEHEQDRIISLLKDAGIGVIVCPSAALSMKQLSQFQAPIHNSIAPVVKLLQADIPVYLGADNIADLFMPIVDGDMWVEARILMEACRFYDIEEVARIACRK